MSSDDEGVEEQRVPAGGVSPPADGERSDPSSGAESERSELEVLARERDEYLDTLRRLQADFENYRKRMLKEQTTVVERASAGLVEQLLPVLDSFELALVNIGPDTDPKVAKGVELVFAELVAALEKAGLERIDAIGKPFDPEEHEAVMQEGGEGEPVVGDVMRTGYRLKGRVLRPAMVKVTR